jgi:hypothetical protein
LRSAAKEIEGGPSAEGACSDYRDVRLAGHLVFSRWSTATRSQRQNCAHHLSPRRQQCRGDSQLTGGAARKPGNRNAIRRGRLFFRHGFRPRGPFVVPVPCSRSISRPTRRSEIALRAAWVPPARFFVLPGILQGNLRRRDLRVLVVSTPFLDVYWMDITQYIILCPPQIPAKLF